MDDNRWYIYYSALHRYGVLVHPGFHPHDPTRSKAWSKSKKKIDPNRDLPCMPHLLNSTQANKLKTLLLSGYANLVRHGGGKNGDKLLLNCTNILLWVTIKKSCQNTLELECTCRRLSVNGYAFHTWYPLSYTHCYGNCCHGDCCHGDDEHSCVPMLHLSLGSIRHPYCCYCFLWMNRPQQVSKRKNGGRPSRSPSQLLAPQIAVVNGA